MLRVTVPSSHSSCMRQMLHRVWLTSVAAALTFPCRLNSSGGGGGALDDEALASLLKRIEHVDTKGKAKRAPPSSGGGKLSQHAAPEPSRLQKQLDHEAEQSLNFRRASSSTPNQPSPAAAQHHSNRGSTLSPSGRGDAIASGRERGTTTSNASHGGAAVATSPESIVSSGATTDKRHEPATASTSSTNASTPPPPQKASTGPARLTLTTSEAIQEGAPQFFIADLPPTPHPSGPTTTTVASEPQHPPHSGCVAMADVIGRVKATPRLLDDVDGKNGEYGEVIVAYEIPFSSPSTPPVSADVECRLYGPELSKFVVDVVRLGDVVHVTGHLYPMEGKMVVVGLPLGGNISVVASTVRGA